MIGTKRNGGASDRVRQAADQVKPVAAQTAAQVKPVAAQVAAQVKPVAAQVAAQVKPVAAQVAAQVKPVAAQVTAQVKPVARSAGIATRRGVYRTRVWVAPQLHHSGQVLEETVAPKVSALLAAAAERIEPVKPQRSRWPRVIGLSILAAAASAAAAAVLRRRAQQGLGTPAADIAPDSTPDTAQTPDRPATSDAQNSQVRTP
jgi:hypothetical protein